MMMRLSKWLSDNRGVVISGLLAVLFVGAFWYWVPRLIVPLYYTANIEKQGAFGDTYGSVNALFTGLAFAGLIITLILQMKELGLQREELRQQRQEFEGTRLALEDQSKTLSLQRFENTFFQLLSCHLDGVSRLKGVRRSKEISGQECISHLAREFQGKLYEILDSRAQSIFDRSSKKDQRKIKYYTSEDTPKRELIPFSPEDHVRAIDEAFSSLSKDCRPQLGPYFGQVYNLLKFVDDSKTITGSATKVYVDIVRPYLDNNELVLIACKGLRKDEIQLRHLIQQCGFLENIAPGTLLHKGHAGIYIPSAFGNKDYKHERV